MKSNNKTAIILVTLSILIIAFAFVMEYIGKRGEEDIGQESEPDRRSPIQIEIEELDWIVQMPLTINENSRPGTPLRRVNGVVIHYIGNPGTTAEQNRNFFQNASVSSNFIVDIDGTIVQCVPVDEVAYASNQRNDDTLSIEVCHPDDTGMFTDESYASVVRLTAWLCGKYRLTTDDVLRHYDVYGKECPRYYVENEDAWIALKDDIQAQMDFDKNNNNP